MIIDRPWLRRVPMILVLAGAMVGLWLFRDWLSYDALRDNRLLLIEFREANPALSMMVFVAVYIAIVSFSLPGATVATLTGGFLFGVFPGVFLNLAGATIGATGLFLAARIGLGDWLAARMQDSDGRIGQLKKSLDQNQWTMLFLLRFAPVVPFFVANLVPALVAVPLHRFVISTALGIIPGAFILTSIGSGLGEVFDRGTLPDLSIFKEPKFVWPILGLCGLSLLPVWLGKRRKT